MLLMVCSAASPHAHHHLFILPYTNAIWPGLYRNYTSLVHMAQPEVANFYHISSNSMLLFSQLISTKELDKKNIAQTQGINFLIFP